ncbi:MAG: nuclear transport factor 2 family protein [Nitrospinae bacterium]|nr:nuclear transport factor 2 family protein [Nitrospinota bacterium]
MEESKIKEEVWRTIQALNRAWAADGKPDELKNYFHSNMVAITCTDRERIEGGDACVAGWKAFSEAAKIHYWKEIAPKVQLYGNGKFAVVTYYWEMSYEMNGKTVKSEGRDMFALVNENGKWQAVADQFSPYPQH